MMSETKRRRPGYDQLCKDIENDVRQSGRSVLCIGGEEDLPPFAYTIGNALKGLPELLLVWTRRGELLNAQEADDGELVTEDDAEH